MKYVVVFCNLLICTKKSWEKKKRVNDNGGVNDDNAASDSSEQHICGMSSDKLMLFNH